MGKQLCSFVGVNSGKTDIRPQKQLYIRKAEILKRKIPICFPSPYCIRKRNGNKEEEKMKNNNRFTTAQLTLLGLMAAILVQS